MGNGDEVPHRWAGSDDEVPQRWATVMRFLKDGQRK